MNDFLSALSKDTFSLIVTSLGVVTSLISLIVTTYSYARSKIRQNEKLKQAAEERFEKVLASNNIIELGQYLDQTIGDFNLYEYSSNETVARRIDRFLDRTQKFVGTTQEIDKEKPPELTTAPHPEFEQIPEEFKKIFNELRTGEPWNALARLRRYIEIVLRQKAQQVQLNIKKFQSAGQLLRMLSDRKIINHETYKPLEYSISVCNRAIHGIDVSQAEAEEAIYAALYGLNSIDKNS